MKSTGGVEDLGSQNRPAPATIAEYLVRILKGMVVVQCCAPKAIYRNIDKTLQSREKPCVGFPHPFSSPVPPIHWILRPVGGPTGRAKGSYTSQLRLCVHHHTPKTRNTVSHPVDLPPAHKRLPGGPQSESGCLLRVYDHTPHLQNVHLHETQLDMYRLHVRAPR